LGFPKCGKKKKDEDILAVARRWDVRRFFTAILRASIHTQLK
jgi:hypothetical protein